MAKEKKEKDDVRLSKLISEKTNVAFERVIEAIRDDVKGSKPVDSKSRFSDLLRFVALLTNVYEGVVEKSVGNVWKTDGLDVRTLFVPLNTGYVNLKKMLWDDFSSLDPEECKKCLEEMMITCLLLARRVEVDYPNLHEDELEVEIEEEEENDGNIDSES